MNRAYVKVLLLSLTTNGSYSLRQFLEQRGCHCSSARTTKEALELFDQSGFDLLLSTQPLEKTSVLLSRLHGSSCSFFYRLPVEDGFWWLPVLRHGRHCLGSAALRPSQFIDALEGAICEIAAGEDSGIVNQQEVQS